MRHAIHVDGLESLMPRLSSALEETPPGAKSAVRSSWRTEEALHPIFLKQTVVSE